MVKKSKKGKKNKPRKQAQKQVIYREPPRPKNSFLGDLGAFAGNAVSKFFGLGSYTLKENSVVDAWNKQVPFMHSTNEKIVFRHREYIGDISGSSTFTPRAFSVNPGLEETFPYLAQLAANFEEYKFRGLVFEYKSTSASALNSTNTALGTVILAAQYRADSTPFVNKLQMENTVWAATTKPSENCFLPIECDPDENPMRCGYVRTGALSANQDIKFYDLCRFSIATVGMQATAVIGELWATYEVELSKPIMVAQGGGTTECVLYYNSSGITSPTVFGNAATGVMFVDTMGVTITGSQRVNFPAGLYGTYRMTIIVRGTAAALSSISPTLTNCTAVLSYPNATPTPNTLSSHDLGTSTAAAQVFDFTFNIPDPNLPANIFFGTFSQPTSATYVQMMISQVPITYPANPVN